MVQWDAIDLVVFDVDGTLYEGAGLRLAMLQQLLFHAWQTRSWRVLQILRTFRRVREALGQAGAEDFSSLQYQRTAQALGIDEAEVRRVADDWLQRRPLPLLARHRCAHVAELFEGLRVHGKRIAVVSDYPAQDKLAALGMAAEHVVCAGEAGMARLKPDPGGLLTVLARSGVPAARALMIGDRPDRDGLMAQRAGVACLIRSRRSVKQTGMTRFSAYNDPLFEPVLRGLA